MSREELYLYIPLTIVFVLGLVTVAGVTRVKTREHEYEREVLEQRIRELEKRCACSCLAREEP